MKLLDFIIILVSSKIYKYFSILDSFFLLPSPYNSGKVKTLLKVPLLNYLGIALFCLVNQICMGILGSLFWTRDISVMAMFYWFDIAPNPWEWGFREGLSMPGWHGGLSCLHKQWEDPPTMGDTIPQAKGSLVLDAMWPVHSSSCRCDFSTGMDCPLELPEKQTLPSLSCLVRVFSS